MNLNRYENYQNQDYFNYYYHYYFIIILINDYVNDFVNDVINDVNDDDDEMTLLVELSYYWQICIELLKTNERSSSLNNNSKSFYYISVNL